MKINYVNLFKLLGGLAAIVLSIVLLVHLTGFEMFVKGGMFAVLALIGYQAINGLVNKGKNNG